MPVDRVILFADIAGSTSLYEKLGNREAHECVVESLDAITRYVEKNQGTVVDYIGDEAMASFKSSADAFNCACDIQKHFSFTQTSHGHRIEIRIGFCRGPVELDKASKPYGDTVNVASRVTALARGSKTITTSETVDTLSEDKKSLCRPFNRVRVKGKSRPLDTVEVVWSQDNATCLFSPDQAEPMVPEVKKAVVTLTFCGQTVQVHRQDTPYILGRGRDSHLVVAPKTASRSHASIEYRHGDMVFVDHSTNGSYLQVDASPGTSLHLRHRDWPMSGEGRISLGTPVQDEDPFVIQFKTTPEKKS